jgi:hypothetical protein
MGLKELHRCCYANDKYDDLLLQKDKENRIPCSPNAMNEPFPGNDAVIVERCGTTSTVTTLDLLESNLFPIKDSNPEGSVVSLGWKQRWHSRMKFRLLPRDSISLVVVLLLTVAIQCHYHFQSVLKSQ